MVLARRGPVVLTAPAAAVVARVLPPQQSARRVALVIGNGACAALNHLQNLVNNATDMAALRRLGYTVTLLTDATQEAMERTVGDLGATLSRARNALNLVVLHACRDNPFSPRSEAKCAPWGQV